MQNYQNSPQMTSYYETYGIFRLTKCIKQDLCEAECTQKNLIEVCALHTLGSDRKS